MTHHVAHTNKMLFELKQQYTSRIEHLQKKIAEQQDEINRLNLTLQEVSK